MTVCIPKRIYNQIALEAWFDRMTHPWETFFTKPEIALGRDIYRNGEIRELEINEYDAIVHAKFDQEECYAMIEWSKGKFNVRASTKDKLLGRALAAAGMYDIEELVSEQASQLPPEKQKKNQEAQKAAAEKEAVIAALLKRRRETTVTPAFSRPLVLSFSIENDALRFVASWINQDESRSIALKKEGQNPGEANAAEREKLIGLASLARKNSFKFNSKNGYYRIKDLAKIQEFIATDFKDKWPKKFQIETDSGVARLSNGIQIADVHFDLQALGDGHLDFSWEMSLADEVLSPDEALGLIRNADNPVLLPDLGLAKLEMEKVELLATWKRWLNLYSDGKIPRYVLFSLFGEDSINCTLSPELKNWRSTLLHKPKLTQEVSSFLRPYQAQGVKWLWHLCDSNCHGLLADEMGLGKTIQVLSLLANRNIYPNSPNLIVCPASVVPVWQNEVQRFFPHIKVQVLKSGNDFYKCNENILWIASYAQMRMHKFLLESQEFGYVVLDEAQLIKNPDAKVTQACMCIRGKHRIILSGTPLENRYLDLWTIFRFLMPGLLGTKRKFEDEIAAKGSKIAEKIRKQIAPFVLRRTKKDVLKELPGKTETDVICPLTQIQKAEYQKLAKEGVQNLGEDIPTAVRERSLSFLTLLTRLRQACCDPDLLPWINLPLEESGKIILLLEKLEEILANGHKVVVFSQFVSLLNRIQSALSGQFPNIPVYQLTGKTIDRGKPVSQFQESEGPGVILVSLRAGGTGITLHSADYVFLMDPWWNPAVEEQAIDRVHRMGQDKAVFVYRMLTSGTIEARIQKLKNEKKGLFFGVMGGMADISNMKNYFDSLSQLIALLPDDHD